MPKKFTDCVKKKGSKVRTLKRKGGKTQKICFDKKGKSVVGEVKKPKKKK